MFFASAARAQPPVDPLPSPPLPPPAAPDESRPPPSSRYDVRASSDIAGYADTDHVFVFTPSISGTVSNPSAGWTIGGHYLVDVVSAASVDIVSTASRRWEEVRQAGALDATKQFGSYSATVSGTVSVEPDYTSLAGGLVLTKDLLEKNLTLLAGYEHGHDVAGRSGTPFSVFSHTIDHDALKTGLTLVLDRATIATGIVEVDFEQGDSSKPYRYVPLFTPGTSVPVGASIDTVNQVRAPERVLEQLPTSRNRYALTLRLAHRFSGSTLRVEERAYDDTWGLFASTTDARYIIDVGKRFEIGPHGRIHGQTPVDFWQRAYLILPGLNFPSLRTGDRELGPLWNYTGGAAARVGLGPAYEPMQWALGFDFNATYTRYIDDLYVTWRVSTIGSISLEGRF